MIRNLLATTAIAALLATGAYAQDTTAPAPAPAAPTEAAPATPEVIPHADGFLATNIIGENVYNSTAEDAETIGDVNDIVLAADGTADQLIIGVGGFLGIGEKNVALPYKEFDWAEKNGDRWLVMATTKEQLQALPDFDRRGYDPAPAPVAATDPAAPATDQTAQAPVAPATPEATTPPADQSAEAPAATTPDAATTDDTKTAAIDKSTLKELPAADLRAEELMGTTVYGADDANIGEIGDILMTADGKIDAYVIDVGGFLGMGEKKVAVGSDNLAFMVDADGNKYLYTNFNKEQLEAQPAYDASSWAAKRDEQRLIITQ